LSSEREGEELSDSSDQPTTKLHRNRIKKATTFLVWAEQSFVLFGRNRSENQMINSCEIKNPKVRNHKISHLF